MRKGWKRTTLGEVAIVNPKEAPLSEVSPFVPMDAVHVGKRFVAYYETRGERTGARARGGDVLFARITPCLENGKVAQLPNWVGPCGGSTEFVVIRGSKSMISDFVYFWASSERTRDTAAGLMTGTTGRQRLSWQDLSKIGLDLPPIEEQRRIVDLISSVDSYIAALQQQADAARVARNAVLSELLSAGGDDWTETTIGEIAKCAGGTAFPHEYQGGDTGTPFVKVSDMSEAGNERYLIASNNYVSDEVVKRLGARVWPMGTVVFAKVGAALLTEKRRILVRDTIFDNNIMGLVPRELINSHFLYLFMETVKLGDFVQPGAVPSVNNSIVSELEIFLPPLDDQERIVEIVSSVDAVIQSAEQAVVKANNLRSGLLSELLSGEHEIPESYDRLFGVT
jgi:hypothetical protein